MRCKYLVGLQKKREKLGDRYRRITGLLFTDNEWKLVSKQESLPAQEYAAAADDADYQFPLLSSLSYRLSARGPGTRILKHQRTSQHLAVKARRSENCRCHIVD